MHTSETIFHNLHYLAIGLYFIAMVVTAVFVIPLQFKMSKVRNGLIRLRQQMLLLGITSEVIYLASIIALTTGAIVPDRDIMLTTLGVTVFLAGLSSLALSLIFSMIYHQDFSPQSVKKHERIDRLEKAQVKREMKE